MAPIIDQDHVKIFTFIDTLKWAIPIYVSASTAIVIAFAGWIYKSISKMREEVLSTVDSAFVRLSNDCDEFGDKIKELELRVRKGENMLIDHRGKIESVIKICEERHEK